VALIGNPNVGKTTVFNVLTGMRQKVGNYPGVTVEKKTGRMEGEVPIEIIDLPGSYSLSPKSLDERIAYDVLSGHLANEPRPDLVVCIVDASNLERNLYLVTQVLDLGIPVIVALNMMDAAEEAGLSIDLSLLSEKLGVPVLPLTASRNEGIGKLKYQIRRTDLSPAPERTWTLMSAVEVEIPALMQVLADEAPKVPERQRFIEVLQCLTSDTMLDYWTRWAPKFQKEVQLVRERLLANKVPYQQAEVIGRYGWLSPLVAQVVTRKKNIGDASVSDKIDAVLTHRIFGPLFFALILLLIFQAVFSWATPLMDIIESSVIGLGIVIRTTFPAGMATDLLVDGVVSGVGNVVVFLPQILLLFFFLGLMEDTGYMARSAFIMDRIMSRVGLGGGSLFGP